MAEIFTKVSQLKCPEHPVIEALKEATDPLWGSALMVNTGATTGNTLNHQDLIILKIDCVVQVSIG